MVYDYELENAEFDYHEKSGRGPILRDLSLKIEQGEFLALVGPSGIGKSTVLLSMAGFLEPSKGAVLFRSRNIYSFSSREIARYRNVGIGIVSQFFNLIMGMSALQNVAIPALLANRPKDEALGRARKLLAEVGLASVSDKHVSALSGGQQQRVAIARSLINSPSVILADEPTGNLDAESSAAISGLFQMVNHEKGTTIVTATHDADLASRADSVVDLGHR